MSSQQRMQGPEHFGVRQPESLLEQLRHLQGFRADPTIDVNHDLPPVGTYFGAMSLPREGGGYELIPRSYGAPVTRHFEDGSEGMIRPQEAIADALKRYRLSGHQNYGTYNSAESASDALVLLRRFLSGSNAALMNQHQADPNRIVGHDNRLNLFRQANGSFLEEDEPGWNPKTMGNRRGTLDNYKIMIGNAIAKKAMSQRDQATAAIHGGGRAF